MTTRLQPEKGTNFIEGATETCSRGNGFEPSGRSVALFNAPMILL